MSYFNRISALAIVLTLALPCLATAQSPPTPDKSPLPLAAPSKSVPFASPQAAQASPQAAYAPVPQYDQPAVVLQAAPRVYAIQRQVLVAADPVAYAACDTSCVAQQAVVQHQVVQRNFVVQRNVGHHQAAFVQRQAVVAQAPRKVKTKSRSRTVTKERRGLFGL